MSEGGALVRFHDWRAARDRKARDAPPFSLPLRRAGGGACLDWACHPGAGSRHVHPSAPGSSQWRRSSAPIVDLPDLVPSRARTRGRRGSVAGGEDRSVWAQTLIERFHIEPRELPIVLCRDGETAVQSQAGGLPSVLRDRRCREAVRDTTGRMPA
jgi:hypothetical protein